jgi:hypothetical protein
MSETVQEADRSHLQQKIDTVLLVFMNAFAHRSEYGQSFVDVGIQLYRDAPLHSFQNPTEFCEWFTEERLHCNEIIRRLPNVHTTDHEEFARLRDRKACAKYFAREMEYQSLFVEPIIPWQ